MKPTRICFLSSGKEKMNPASVLLNNPDLSKLDPEKLKFLLELSTQNKSVSAKEMMSSLMSAKNSANERGLSFSNEEMTLIIEILKQHMNQEEKQKVDRILQLFENMPSKKRN